MSGGGSAWHGGQAWRTTAASGDTGDGEGVATAGGAAGMAAHTAAATAPAASSPAVRGLNAGKGPRSRWSPGGHPGHDLGIADQAADVGQLAAARAAPAQIVERFGKVGVDAQRGQA